MDDKTSMMESSMLDPSERLIVKRTVDRRCDGAAV